MDFVNEDFSQNIKIKPKMNRRESLLSKISKNNPKIESSISNNNFQKVSGYSTIGNQVTEFSTFITTHNLQDKTLKDLNKLDINFSKKLNPENIDYLCIKKLKAFKLLEDLDSSSNDDEIDENNNRYFKDTRKFKIPKLDFSEIFQYYETMHIKVRVVKGISSSSSSVSVSSYSCDSRYDIKYKKNVCNRKSKKKS